eukprot:scaffold146380_cov33-Attheya_sp.AAC.1
MTSVSEVRVKCGPKNSANGSFGTDTTHPAPGNPDGGDGFNIASKARYYLEGAIEYLDAEGEYHCSGGYFAVGCVLVAGGRSSVGCLHMSQRSERWGVGCLGFGHDGGVGDGDSLERPTDRPILKLRQVRFG